MSADEITMFLKRVQDGRDEDASAELWEHYFERLQNVAKKNIVASARRERDEEDLALSAMNSFFRAANEGRLSGLQNRDELWRLLVTIVIRKANRQRNKAMTLKRGGGHVQGESIFEIAGEDHPGLAGIPDEDLVTDLMSECRELLGMLEDGVQQKIAMLLMEGFNLDEIAEKLGISRSSVKRKKDLIKEFWSERLKESD